MKGQKVQTDAFQDHPASAEGGHVIPAGNLVNATGLTNRESSIDPRPPGRAETRSLPMVSYHFRFCRCSRSLVSSFTRTPRFGTGE